MSRVSSVWEARGRQPGYQNYGVEEQKLLVAVVEKFKPLGRNMWEDVAEDYNARRARTWIHRDCESLKRKFRNLYIKPKPTGYNGDMPPKLELIRLAQEIQVAIDEKTGTITSHDGFDRGEDDAHLLATVNTALGTTDGAADVVDGVEDCTEPGRPDPTTMDDRQHRQGDDDSQNDCVESGSQNSSGLARGTILTSVGAFDVSLAEDVCSGADCVDEEELNHDDETINEEEGECTMLEASGEAASLSAPAANLAVFDVDALSALPAAAARTVNTQKPKSRSRRCSSANRSAIPTFADPEGQPLARDPIRAVDDAIEMDRHKTKSTTSNRLGSQDLRILRDNMPELTGKSPSPGSKRDAGYITSFGATYAANKRTSSKRRMESIKKDVQEVELRNSAGGEIMQYILFFKEDADRNAGMEDKRRREEHEQRLAIEKLDREERERIRYEEAAAQEARRCQELEMARLQRDEQNRKDALAAETARMRHEERLERERADARERH